MDFLIKTVKEIFDNIKKYGWPRPCDRDYYIITSIRQDKLKHPVFDEIAASYGFPDIFNEASQENCEVNVNIDNMIDTPEITKFNISPICLDPETFMLCRNIHITLRLVYEYLSDEKKTDIGKKIFDLYEKYVSID